MKKIFSIAASLTAALLFGVSCDNGNSGADAPVPAPEIVSISPDSAPAGESVTVAGKNFSADAAANVVTFGDADATVVQASETELVVTVPQLAAGEVDVVVTVGDKSSEAVKFTVEAELAIISCTASFVTAGESVTVEGGGFDGAVIKIGETLIEPTLAYDDFFKFTMPSLTKGEHQIVVSKGSKTVQSDKFVYYSLPHFDVTRWAGNPSSTAAENAVKGGNIEGADLHFYFPHGMCWDADGKLCVANATNPSGVHFVDMNTKEATCVSSGKHIYGICPVGNKVYAVNKGNNELGVIENGKYSKITLKSGENEYSLKYTKSDDSSANVNPLMVNYDGTYLYFTLRDNLKVIKVDEKTLQVVKEYTTSIKPYAVAMNSDKTKLFVGPNDSNKKIVMLDVASGEEIPLAGSQTAPTDNGVLEGPAKNVAIGQVVAFLLDTDGYLYFSDQTACRLRVLIPGVGGDYANGVVKTVAGTAIGTNGEHGLNADYALGDALTQAKFGKEGISGIVKYGEGFLVGGYKRHIIYKLSPKVNQ